MHWTCDLMVLGSTSGGSINNRLFQGYSSAKHWKDPIKQRKSNKSIYNFSVINNWCAGAGSKPKAQLNEHWARLKVLTLVEISWTGEDCESIATGAREGKTVCQLSVSKARDVQKKCINASFPCHTLTCIPPWWLFISMIISFSHSNLEHVAFWQFSVNIG